MKKINPTNSLRGNFYSFLFLFFFLILLVQFFFNKINKKVIINEVELVEFLKKIFWMKNLSLIVVHWPEFNWISKINEEGK